MPQYQVEYTIVTHQTWVEIYDAKDQDEAEDLLIQDIGEGLDSSSDDVVDSFFQVTEI